jgi:hypothetical protein
MADPMPKRDPLKGPSRFAAPPMPMKLTELPRPTAGTALASPKGKRGKPKGAAAPGGKVLLPRLVERRK